MICASHRCRLPARIGWSVGRLRLNHQLAIWLELCIDREQMHWLGHCLSNQQTVKRIGVMHWQAGDKQRMLRPDGKFMETVSLNLVEKLLRIGIHLAQTDLDCNLPDGG